jgi:hypothetical protein
MNWRRRLEARHGRAVCVLVGNSGRQFWITAREEALLRALRDNGGKPIRQRELSARLGYSQRGLTGALQTFDKMGLGSLVTVRGRHGSTRFAVQRDLVIGYERTSERRYMEGVLTFLGGGRLSSPLEEIPYLLRCAHLGAVVP